MNYLQWLLVRANSGFSRIDFMLQSMVLGLKDLLTLWPGPQNQNILLGVGVGPKILSWRFSATLTCGPMWGPENGVVCDLRCWELSGHASASGSQAMLLGWPWCQRSHGRASTISLLLSLLPWTLFLITRQSHVRDKAWLALNTQHNVCNSFIFFKQIMYKAKWKILDSQDHGKSESNLSSAPDCG